jgi:hypothetical protein
MFTTLTAPAATHVERFRARRAASAQRARLRAELASYKSPSERAELEAMLARHSADEVAELEAMIR